MDILKIKMRKIVVAVKNAMGWPNHAAFQKNYGVHGYGLRPSGTTSRHFRDKAAVAVMLAALAGQPMPVFSKPLEPLPVIQRRVAQPATTREMPLAPPVATRIVAAADSAFPPPAEARRGGGR